VSRFAWLWQAAMAAAVVAQLSGVKPKPQLVLVGALAVVVAVQRVYPDTRAAIRMRTAVLVASTWAGIASVVAMIAIAATRDVEHPTMPIGEVALAFLAGTVCAVVVLWLRIRGTDAPANEPRLARVLELFALAAITRVAIDWLG
jgi:hypothetical protein